MNEILLSGRIAKNPVVYSTNGSHVCNFTIALNEFPRNNSTFVDCVAWGQVAQNLALYQQKGDMIEINGFLFATSAQNSQNAKKNNKDNNLDNQILKVGCKSIIYLSKANNRKKQEEKNEILLDSHDASISQEATNYPFHFGH